MIRVLMGPAWGSAEAPLAYRDSWGGPRKPQVKSRKQSKDARKIPQNHDREGLMTNSMLRHI